MKEIAIEKQGKCILDCFELEHGEIAYTDSQDIFVKMFPLVFCLLHKVLINVLGGNAVPDHVVYCICRNPQSMSGHIQIIFKRRSDYRYSVFSNLVNIVYSDFRNDTGCIDNHCRHQKKYDDNRHEFADSSCLHIFF